MKSQKRIRRLIGAIVVGFLLFLGGFLPVAQAQADLNLTEEGMRHNELFREIERQEASVAPLQVWNLTRREVKEAKLNWATGWMGKAVFAAVRGDDIDPIPGNAVYITRSAMGFGALDDFRFATTLLENETGQPMAQLLPSAVRVASSGPARNVSGGWGGFAEFGFFAVAGFIFSMCALIWVARSARPPMEEEEEYMEYRKAA